MYTQVAEKWLAQQPKLTRLQREFLEKALAFYEQFAAEGKDNPQARLEVARARRRMGAIRASSGSSTSPRPRSGSRSPNSRSRPPETPTSSNTVRSLP